MARYGKDKEVSWLLPPERAVLFWRYTYVLMGFTLGFAVLYVWLYRRIVRFRTPGVLRRG